MAARAPDDPSNEEQPKKGGAATKERDPLAEAFAQLQDAQKLEDADKAAEKIADALGSLDDEQRRRVLGTQAVRELVDRVASASTSLKPGTKLRDKKGRLYGKVPWSPEKMIEFYGEHDMQDFIPPQTRMVSVNGVDVYLQAGHKVRLPSVFIAVATEAHQAELNQRSTAEKLMRDKFGEFGKVYDLD